MPDVRRTVRETGLVAGPCSARLRNCPWCPPHLGMSIGQLSLAELFVYEE